MIASKKQIDLKGLDKNELLTFVESIGEKRFRAQQFFEWIYGRNVNSFDEMTNVSKQLRTRLTKISTIGQLKLVAQETSSKDGSTKLLFELSDGLKIESVVMQEKDRFILCISTQVGCALDCKFCATGMMGLQRNLTSGEILDQFLQARKIMDKPISNIVFMGMGEPFHNYDNLLKACSILCDDDGPNMSSRHIVISTSGLVSEIYRFADEKHKYQLAISLNATTDAVRTRIMPIAKKWPLPVLLKAVRYYLDKVHRPVTFEYVLLNEVNDTDEDAERLRRLVSGMLCKINIIPYNPAGGTYGRSSQERIMNFYGKLADLPTPVTIRWSKGSDISAGCGQLATKKKA